MSADSTKTTTAAVLFLSMRNVFTGHEDTEAFGRRISPEVVRRAVAVTTLATATIIVGCFLLMLTQSAPFDVLLFEAVSAFGTVGLSLGATAGLDDSGKAVVMLLMLIGRVGPLSAAASLNRKRPCNSRLPRAEVIVG